MPYEDIFSSVDVVVTKPGYGVVAELGCTGKPGILISRNDWPEENHLTRWLETCGRAAVVPSLDELSAERLTSIASTLITTAPQFVPGPGGEAIISNIIREKFSTSSMLAF
jgi:UDP-N-acetylglucosamine:LPS N-acetylglucosamine transferase